MARRLSYVYDPMCSWCWAFNNVWQTIRRELPADIEVRYLLGGLAADSDEPMASTMQQSIKGYWEQIQQQLPDTEFNYDFWDKCEPRRSTYPACRAVIAARSQNSQAEPAMLLAIQQAYYLQAKNPSNDDVLIECAKSIGLNEAVFTTSLGQPETQQKLLSELRYVRSIGVSSFPSLVLEQEGKLQLLNYDYQDPEVLLKQLR